MTQANKITSESIATDTKKYIDNGGEIEVVPVSTDKERLDKLKSLWEKVNWTDEEDL